MTILTGPQVAAAAYLGGFRGNDVVTAVAVAYGESTWNTASVNACCTGLWQIHRKAHADIIKGQDLTDPVVNAKLAHQIWAGDWCGGKAPNGHCNKWEAYQLDNAGKTWSQKMKDAAVAYSEFNTIMQMGQNPQDILKGVSKGLTDQVPGLGDIVDTAGAIAGFAKSVVDIFNRLGAWIADPNSWLRVAEFVGGGILVVAGLRITFNQQFNAVTKAVVQTVVPGGKAGAAAAVRKSAGTAKGMGKA
jgi:hypothetical protein